MRLESSSKALFAAHLTFEYSNLFIFGMASVVRKKSHSISDGSQYSSQPSGESVDDIKVDDNFFVVHTAGKESNMVVVKNPVPFFPATIEDDLEITSARNSGESKFSM